VEEDAGADLVGAFVDGGSVEGLTWWKAASKPQWSRLSKVA